MTKTYSCCRHGYCAHHNPYGSYVPTTWPATGTTISITYQPTIVTNSSNSTIWTDWQVPKTNTNVIWNNWLQPQFATTTTPTLLPYDRVWDQWLHQLRPVVTYQSAAPPTAEEIAAIAVAREQELLAAEVRQAERVLAEVKAHRLLEMMLSDEQKAELGAHGQFHVRGSRGRRYCIHARGQSGNVDLLNDDGSVMGRFCAHPKGYLPDADAWLAQALALETDEDAFLAVANLHRGHRPTELALAA